MRSLVAKSGLLGCPQSKIQNPKSTFVIRHSSFVNLSVEASAKSDPASSKSRITDLFPMLFPGTTPASKPQSPLRKGGLRSAMPLEYAAWAI